MKWLSENDRNKYFVAKHISLCRVEGFAFIFLAVLAVCTILICSKSSPFYPMNDSLDANAFFTIGRAMKSGYVPYRDFYDHKGPVLFVLHWIAACISETTFSGVFFIEVIAAFFYLLFSYKSLRLYLDKYSIITMPVLALLTYTTISFVHGDSVEEFSLPLLMFAIYHGLKMLRSEDMVLSWKTWFLIGVTSGCVLWMKFTILGFYAGWIIVPLWVFIKRGRLRELIRGIVFLLCGVGAVTVPLLIYFGINGAIGDWFNAYFVNNLTAYANFSSDGIIYSILQNLLTGFLVSLMCSVMIYFLLIIGLIWLFMSDKKRIGAFWCLIFLFQHITIFAGGQFYTYYALDHSIFYIPGIIALFHLISAAFGHRFSSPRFRTVCILGLFACVLGEFFLSRNTADQIFKSKEEMPQYQLAEVIKNEGYSNPSVLTYGTLDIGLYFTSGILPPCRFFYIPNQNIPEPLAEQNKLISDAAVDFVAIRASILPSDKYVKIYETHGVFEERDYKYALYKKK